MPRADPSQGRGVPGPSTCRCLRARYCEAGRPRASHEPTPRQWWFALGASHVPQPTVLPRLRAGIAGGTWADPTSGRSGYRTDVLRRGDHTRGIGHPTHVSIRHAAMLVVPPHVHHRQVSARRPGGIRAREDGCAEWRLARGQGAWSCLSSTRSQSTHHSRLEQCTRELCRYLHIPQY